MPTVDDLLETLVPDTHEPYARIMLFGAEGSTKTVTACSVGRPDRKVALLEADPEGYVSLYNHPEVYFLPDGKTKRVVRFQYEGLSQVEAFADYLDSETFDDYDTLVIDTASGIVNSDLDVITAERFRKGKMDEEVPDRPAYRLNQDRVRRAFTPLMRVKKHIVLVSHARVEKDNLSVSRFTPDMPQAVRNHLTRLCHMIGYLTADVSESDGNVIYTRRMQVHPTRAVTAKSRIGGLPVVIDNPNLRDIVEDWVKNGASLVDETNLAPESDAVVSVSHNDPSGLEL